ncbi:hypothetical protein MDAP_000820 [Mitosporidium daphniae]
METSPDPYSRVGKDQHSYLYSERFYDNCGHKIGRKRFLLSPSSFKCHHNSASPDKKSLFSSSTTNKNFEVFKSMPKSASIVGPNVFLFQDVNWSKVLFLNEINGVFPKESQLITPPLSSLTSTATNMILPVNSSISSLFEYGKDLESHQNHHPLSADEETDLIYSSRSAQVSSNLYPAKIEAYHNTHDDEDRDAGGGGGGGDAKTTFQPASKVGRPRGSGRRRGAYGKRRGGRGYKRGRASASYQSSHAIRRFQVSESSATSGNEESEAEEETLGDRKKFQTEKYSPKPAFTSSSSSSSSSSSNEDNLSQDRDEDENINTSSEDEDENENMNPFSDKESRSETKKKIPAPQKKRGRKPKAKYNHTQGNFLYLTLDDNSSSSGSNQASEEEDDELFRHRVSSLRSRKSERPVYNTSRRARGSSRGRGGRRPLNAQNLIRLGSTGGLSTRNS